MNNSIELSASALNLLWYVILIEIFKENPTLYPDVAEKGSILIIASEKLVVVWNLKLSVNSTSLDQMPLVSHFEWIFGLCITL